MVGGDVYQSSWDDLNKICLDYSRSTVKKARGYQSTTTKGISPGILKLEISNLLSNFKQDIINDVTTHLDTMMQRRSM